MIGRCGACATARVDDRRPRETATNRARDGDGATSDARAVDVSDSRRARRCTGRREGVIASDFVGESDLIRRLRASRVSFGVRHGGFG